MLLMHGWLLEGSGSNLWTRAILKSVCKLGHEVHLMCQEPHPEIYSFIGEVWTYPKEGPPTCTLKRETGLPGKCIMHKPYIGEVLPVFVKDKYEEYENVVPMIEMETATLENYMELNLKALMHILKEHKIQIMHANHAVLMSVIAYRAMKVTGVPYVVMPHGSAIEYAVKKDQRIFDMALEAFTNASLIVTLSKEIQTRVLDLFPTIPDLASKLHIVKLGVDIADFVPKDRGLRKTAIKELCEALAEVPRGKKKEDEEKLIGDLLKCTNCEQFEGILNSYPEYEKQKPDFHVEEKLSQIPWENPETRVILFVGRLISGKGAHLILTALPLIIQKYPNTYMVLVGHGPHREIEQGLIAAFISGNKELIKAFAAKEELIHVQFFLGIMEEKGQLDTYLATAKTLFTHVIYTGYLTLNYLAQLYPAVDLCIFPSIVAEAGPLVFYESIACGIFPMGIYIAGMKLNIDAGEGFLEKEVLELMKLSDDPKLTIPDIISNTNKLFAIQKSMKKELRAFAEQTGDWMSISKGMLEAYQKFAPK